MDVQVIGNVVTVVLQRRGKKGKQPHTCDAQILKVVQFLHQSLEIADAIRIAVLECADMQLIDNRILGTTEDPPRCPGVLP